MFKIIKIEETTTVMDYIKQFNINTVVIANKQTKGRGKGNRTWISRKSNNLYMAISMDSSNKNINYFNYCFISAIVMVESLKAHAVKYITEQLVKAGVGQGWQVQISHAGAPDRAELALKVLSEAIPEAEYRIYPLSPAFITQGGPGCVAVQYNKL